MLNSQCKQVLNCLIKLSKNNIEFNGLETFEKYLSHKTFQNIWETVSYLSKNEYITVRYADDDFYSINLTYKGLAYKSFNVEIFKSFLLKSIIVPIFISIVTTILTMLLEGLL